MVAMTTAEPWPAAGQLFTVDDLERMPDDGRRYELIDGVHAGLAAAEGF